jgi:dienelactone hydrolase
MKTTSKQERHGISKYVRISAGDVPLLADLQIPELANSVVIFAYEFGGSRNHPRTRHVARVMRENGLATLLCDLLTDEEEAEDEVTGAYRKNAELLAERLVAVTEWAAKDPDMKKLKMGYFGACTGGGAVLIAAAKLPKKVKAVVSRGGRVDLAAKSWSGVKCPTLLIVGEQDADGVKLSREAFEQLTCEKEFQVIPGASHLFGEPGTLETMAKQSAKWLRSRLGEPGV